MKRSLLTIGIISISIFLVFAGCSNVVQDDPSSHVSDDDDSDPVDPGDLPEVGDDALPAADGTGSFFALLLDVDDSSLSLVTSSPSSPADITTVVDGDISTTAPFLKLSPAASNVAYVNLDDQLIFLECATGQAHVAASYGSGALDMDEFWWYDDNTLLFSAGAEIMRAVLVGDGLEKSNTIGSEECHHDLALNPFTQTAEGTSVALTYIFDSGGSTFATVYSGYYADHDTYAEIVHTQPLVSHVDAFGIAFDPMLTWLSRDLLVWRADQTVCALFYCNIAEYPEPGSFGQLAVDVASAPTDFLMSPDYQTIYFYGRGNVVSSIPNPAIGLPLEAEPFYTDDLEYTVSKLAFSPSGNYFVVGNRGRLRCFDTADPSIRYRWWEDSSLEHLLDDGSVEILEIWWQ